jgi:uncharacterized protein YueI
MIEKWTYIESLKSNLQNGHSELLRNNILEYSNDMGSETGSNFKIISNSQKKLFVELDIKVQQAENKKSLILHENITLRNYFITSRKKSQNNTTHVASSLK